MINDYFKDDSSTIDSSHDSSIDTFSLHKIRSHVSRNVKSTPKIIKIPNFEYHLPCIPNGYGRFHCACRKGDYSTVQEMLQDVDMNITDDMEDHGVTPLHVSLIHEHYDVAKLLLQKGARVDTTTNNGWTPLHVASSMGCNDMVQHLLEEYNADCTARDSRGWTPLFVAIHRGHMDVIRTLLLSSSSLQQQPKLFQEQESSLHSVSLGNEIDFCGQTLLMTACLGGHVNVVELLLTMGITNVDATDDDGWTVYTYAEKWNTNKNNTWRHLVTMLEEYDTSLKK
jgi:ankyrin repeat protein